MTDMTELPGRPFSVSQLSMVKRVLEPADTGPAAVQRQSNAKSKFQQFFNISKRGGARLQRTQLARLTGMRQEPGGGSPATRGLPAAKTPPGRTLAALHTAKTTTLTF